MAGPKDAYNLLKDQGMTTLTEDEWVNKYTDPKNTKAAYDFFKSQGFTQLDEQSFVDKYFKKNTVTESVSVATSLESPKTTEQVTTETITEEAPPTALEFAPPQVKHTVSKAPDVVAPAYKEAQSIVRMPEERAKKELETKLAGTNYKVETVGAFGDALKITNAETGKSTRIDLQPSSTTWQAESATKLQSILEAPKTGDEALLRSQLPKADKGTPDVPYGKAEFNVKDMNRTYNKYGVFLWTGADDMITITMPNGKSAKFRSDDPRGVDEYIQSNIDINTVRQKNAELLTKTIEQGKDIKQDITEEIDLSPERISQQIISDHLPKIFERLDVAGIQLPPGYEGLRDGGQKMYDPYGGGSIKKLSPKDLVTQLNKAFENNKDAQNIITKFEEDLWQPTKEKLIASSSYSAIEKMAKDMPEYDRWVTHYESINQRVPMVKEYSENQAVIATAVDRYNDALETFSTELQNIYASTPDLKVDFPQDINGRASIDVKSGDLSADDRAKLQTYVDTFNGMSQLNDDILVRNEQLASQISDVDLWNEVSGKNYKAWAAAKADFEMGARHMLGGTIIAGGWAADILDKALSGITPGGTALSVTDESVGQDAIEYGRGLIRAGEEKLSYYESPKTYAEAIRDGELGVWALRQTAAQTPMLTLTLGSMGYGSMIGMTDATIATLMATGFGVSAMGGKYDELTTRQELADQARIELDKINEAYPNVADAPKDIQPQLLAQIYDLEGTIRDGDISNAQKVAATLATGAIVGGTMRFMGTIPNAIRLKGAMNPQKTLVQAMLRSNYDATKQFLVNAGVSTAHMVGMMTSMELFEKLSDGAILNDEVDLSELDDVAMMALITGAAMNIPMFGAASIMGQHNVNSYKAEMKTRTDNIRLYKSRLLNDANLTQVQRANLHAQIAGEFKAIADISASIEGDVLVMGPERIKEIMSLKGLRIGMLDRAGVIATDTPAQMNAKVREYLRTLPKDRAQEYMNSIKQIEHRILELSSNLDYTGKISEIFGNRGEEIAATLKKGLSEKEKFTEVYKQVRDEINTNAKKEYDATETGKVREEGATEWTQQVEQLRDMQRQPEQGEVKPSEVSPKEEVVAPSETPTTAPTEKTVSKKGKSKAKPKPKEEPVKPVEEKAPVEEAAPAPVEEPIPTPEKAKPIRDERAPEDVTEIGARVKFRFHDGTDMIGEVIGITETGKVRVRGDNGINYPMRADELAIDTDFYKRSPSQVAGAKPPTPIGTSGLTVPWNIDYSMADAWSASKRAFRKYMTVTGLLPEDVYKSVNKKKFNLLAEQRKIDQTSKELQRVIKESYKNGPSETDLVTMDRVLHGEVSSTVLPIEVASVIMKMRANIDAMTDKIIDILQKELDEGIQSGKWNKKQILQREGQIEKLKANKGKYVNTSYQVFDIGKDAWMRRMDPAVRQRVEDLVRSELQQQIDKLEAKSSLTPRQATRLDELRDRIQDVRGVLGEMLNKADKDAIGSGYSMGSKEGTIDMSILKKKKNLEEAVKEYFGEYKDPLYNYVSTMTKMTAMIENAKFLDEMWNQFQDKYFFTNPKEGFDVPIAGENSGYGALNGKFTSKDIKDALTETRQAYDGWYKLLMQASLMAKMSKTVLSLQTQVRNFISNPMIMIANGHFNLHDLYYAGKVIAEDWRKAPGKMQADLDEMVRLGLFDESPIASTLNEIINLIRKDKNFETLNETLIDKVKAKTWEKAKDFYQAGDTIWKIVQYKSTIKDLTWAYEGRGKSADAIKQEAADIVRNTVPTYSMAPLAARQLARAPLIAPFLLFSSEMVRISYNQMKLTSEYLTSGNERLMILGAKRLAGMTMAASTGFLLQWAFKQKNNISNDEDKAYRRLIMPPWSKNSNIIYWKKEGSKIVYIDFSFSDPYNLFKRPVQAFLDNEDWEKALAEGASEFLAPVTNRDLVTGKLLEFINNADSRTGRKLFLSGDKLSTYLKTISDKTWEVFEPGTITSVKKIVKGFKGTIEPSGRTYNPWRELGAAITGTRVTDGDIPTGFKYKMYDAKDKLADARSIYTRARSMTGLDAAELQQKKDDSIDAWNKRWEEVMVLVDDMKSLGYLDKDIIDYMQAAGISKENARSVVGNSRTGKMPAIPEFKD